MLQRLATELKFLISFFAKRKTKKGQKSYVALIRLRHLNGHKSASCTARDDEEEGGDGDKAKAEGTEEEEEDRPGEENPNRNNLFTR